MLPQIVTVNPMAKHKRRAKHSRKPHSHRATNRHRAHSRRTHSRRRHRSTNPLKLPSMGGLGHQVVPALIGGAGAIGVDVALAYAAPYLPAMLTSGWGRIGAQVLAALGLSMVATKVVDRETGKAVLAGALIITAYSSLRQVLAPTLGASVKGLSGLADFSDYQDSGWSGGRAVGGTPLSAYMPQGRLGAYMRAPGLGYMNPGAILTGIRGRQLAAYMPSAGLGSFGSGGDGMSDLG